MKIVIAPDSFKDALRAGQVAQRIATGVRSIATDARIDLCPIADGGEGFMDAIKQSLGSSAISKSSMTVDPLGRSIEAAWLRVRNDDGSATAVLELAAASGLERLTASERDPMRTSTFGTGALIYEALSEGTADLLLGIGGSATNDAGCGIAQAMGVRFFDQSGQEIDKPVQGAMLTTIARIDADDFALSLRGATLRIACDVDNPLAGPNGAAHVYAPQKGATPEQVEQLDQGLRHMAQLWRDQLGIDVGDLTGAGAAGGVGGGLVAMLGAELVPGAELVLDTIGFDKRIKGADLVVTGEGKLDHQSLQGKAAMAVAKRCQAAGVPCVALVGCVGEGAKRALEHGLAEYRVIGRGLDPNESIRRTGELLEVAAAKLLRDRLS